MNTPCRTGRGELGALAGGAISGMFGGASSLALSALALPAVGIALFTAALAPMISMIATTAGYAVESDINGEGDSYGFERAIIKGLYTSPTVLAPPLTAPILSPATELTAQHYEMKTSFERGKLKCECGQ